MCTPIYVRVFIFLLAISQDLPTERRREGNASQFSSTSAHGGSYTSAAKKYDRLRNYDKITQLSTGFMTEENLVDANTEKELVSFSV